MASLIYGELDECPNSLRKKILLQEAMVFRRTDQWVEVGPWPWRFQPGDRRDDRSMSSRNKAAAHKIGAVAIC